MPIHLVGNFQGQSLRFELGEGLHRVGRGRDSEISLKDPSVSREHAEIRVDAAGVALRDLGSHNGSWVNGGRIESCRLAPGDRLRFGDQELLLLDPEGKLPSRDPGSTDALLAEAESVRTSLRLAPAAYASSPADLTTHDKRLLQAVAEAGHLLVKNGTLSELFDSVLQLVDRAISARRIALLLVEPDSDLPQLRAARPALPSGQKIMLSRAMMDAVLTGREALRVTDARLDERFRDSESIVAQDVHSALVAPLFDNEKVIGLIYADSSDPRVIYDSDQLRVFTLLANLIAVKITNTRLLEAEQAKELLEHDLATAVRIQQSLLPSTFPEVPPYEIHAHQIPCRWVGGDLFDVVQLQNGDLGLVLGDVSGKGLGAAILMSNVLASLRMLWEEDLPLPRVVERLNRQLLRSTAPSDYLTLFLARLSPHDHRLVYVNAGHNPPMLFSPGGRVVELEATGTPVGLLDLPPSPPAEVVLEEGSMLCVFSDGITEGRREDEFFGEERLRESILRRFEDPLKEVSAGVLKDLEIFLEGTPLADDTTLLLLRRRRMD